MNVKSRFYATAIAVSTLSSGGLQSKALAAPHLFDPTAMIVLVSGRCTVEQGFRIFHGDAAGEAALEDTTFFAEDLRQVPAEIEARLADGRLDADALETLDNRAIARSAFVCRTAGTLVPSRTSTQRRYMVLDDGYWAQAKIAGIAPAQLRQIAIAHETAHAYTKEATLEGLALRLHRDPAQLSELIADAYMLLRLQSQDPRLRAPIAAFLDYRHTRTDDLMHPVLSRAARASGCRSDAHASAC